MKVMITTPHATRFIAVPSPAPWPRSRSGRISELYTHAMGPSPMEKNTTYATTAAMVVAAVATVVVAAAAPSPPANAANSDPTTTSDAAMPPVLTSSSGRRPARSTSAMAMRIDPALATPKTTLRLRSKVFDFTPAMASIRGPYSTTESIPDACWNNWSVRTIASTRRTPGFAAASFHALLLLPPPSPETKTTSSISSSRRSASGAVSDVRWSTSLASAIRPFITSHLGDSGMVSVPNARNTGGTTPAANITRHDRCAGSPEKASLHYLGNGGEEATGGRGGDLGGVDGGDDEVVADGDAGDEAADHEGVVASGEGHAERAEEEEDVGEDDGEASAEAVGGPAGEQRAGE
nr:unnamed protein product [Digitaria exilis]